MTYRVVLLSTVTMALLSFLVSNVKLLVTNNGGRNRVAVMALSSSVQGPWKNHHRCTATTQQHALSFHKCLSTKSSSSFMAQLFMSSSDDENVEDDNAIIQERTSFNIPILKKETQRLTLRTHKKIGKVSTRIRNVEQQYETLRLAIDNANEGDDDEEEKLLQQLEQAPDINIHKAELNELQSRLKKLNYLEEQYTKLPLLKKSKQLSISNDVSKFDKDHEIHTVIKYIIELDISDDESQKQKKIEQDAKNRRAKAMKKMDGNNDNNNQQGGPRLPYRRYYSEKKTEIRVGKQATDNDVLSLSPEHRSSSHWWYHASGCPGSHVVLCTDVSSPSEEDILDAASLAALKSKCIHQSVIKVSMTRVRNVSKPPGAKAGLVQLNGDVKTVTLRKSEVEKRCKRLEETVIVN